MKHNAKANSLRTPIEPAGTPWHQWLLVGLFAAIIHLGPLAAAAWSSGGLDHIMQTGAETPASTTLSNPDTLPHSLSSTKQT